MNCYYVSLHLTWLKSTVEQNQNHLKIPHTVCPIFHHSGSLKPHVRLLTATNNCVFHNMRILSAQKRLLLPVDSQTTEHLFILMFL